jgi:hypothetical protein
MAAKAKRSKPKFKPAVKKATKKITKVKPVKTPEVAMRKKGGMVNEESKALFLDHHLPKIARLRELSNTANANLRNGYKTAKKDGFLQHDFDVAFQLKTQTGEKQIKAAIARDMTIAKWLGYGLGKQLDLFVEADDHDIEMQAYADGEEASRTNKPASPIYAPGTPGFEAYMRGYHDHQEGKSKTQDELAKGFKKLEPEPTSGTRVTRSQFKAQQAAAKKQADNAEERSSLFQKKTGNGPAPEAAE